jgi:uncharacterized protein
LLLPYNDKLYLSILSVLFIAGILQISYSSLWGTLFILMFVCILYIFYQKYRYLTANVLFFLIGYSLYKYTGTVIAEYIESKEWKVLLNRISLLFVIASLYFISFLFKKSCLFFNNKPDWDEKIYFPFIWKGFHSIKVSYFLFIAILINIIVFLPFLIYKDTRYLGNIALFTLSFSIANGILEELIWRGLLLQRFRESTSDGYALLITSLAFGLNHISIGMPWFPSLLFSMGGIFFAGVVLRSNSIYPSILWHSIINVGMVLSGLILR